MSQAPFMTTVPGKLTAAGTVWLLLGGAAVSFAGNGSHFPLMMTIIIFTGLCLFISAGLLMANDYPIHMLKLVCVMPFVAALSSPTSYIVAEGAPLAGVGFLVAAAVAAAIYMKGASDTA